LLLLLGLPYFIFSAVATSPATLLFAWISTKFKDKAFFNTLRYLTALALLPVALLLMGATVFLLLPWMWGVAFVLLFTPAFALFHDYLNLAQGIISDIKWLINKNLRKKFKNIFNPQEKM
jgi:hypothetical protein